MLLRKAGVWLSALLVSGVAASGVAAEPTPREVLGSELLVKEYLDKLDVPPGQIHPLHDGVLAHAFPDYLFFVAVYPPASAANLPAPLKRANVFAVDPEGKVKLLAGSPEIVELFQAGFRTPKGEARCREVVRVTLLLFQAQHPEYKFILPVEEIRISPDGNGTKRGVGKLVVKEGGTGAIDVTLTLDANCDPLKVVETVTLKPAQLALAAPTVVEIAAAEKVVKTQLAAAKLSVDPVRYIDDPVVLRTFPGYLFFVVPPTDPDRGAATTLDVMVVGPDGLPQRLFGKGFNYIGWFNGVFGPAGSDPRIKEGLGVLARLQAVIHPGFKFGPVGDPQITVDDGGHKIAVTRTLATGPGGREWALEVKLMFGRRGKVVAWWFWFKPV